MDIYQELQGVASGLFKEFKQGSPQLVRSTPAGTGFNPGNPTLTPLPINATVRGVSMKYVTAGLAVASDLQVSMPADVVPAPADLVRLNGRDYKIVQILPKPATGTVAAYLLIIRK